MLITRATTERRYGSVVIASIDGFGRNITAMRDNGHTNPSANDYDRAVRPNRALVEAFKGDFWVEKLSTGWYSIKVRGGDTFRVNPTTRVMWSTTGMSALSQTVADLFTFLAETKEDGWEN